MQKIENKKSRIIWIDILRGFMVISMVVYHALWDVVCLQGINIPWFTGIPGYLWQQITCYIFIFLSGFCWCFGKNPLKKGLLISEAGAVITLITVLFFPEGKIIFGVLTFLGAATLLMIPFQSIAKKIPAGAGLMVSLILFFLFRDMNQGFLGFESLHLLPLPEFLYQNGIMTFLGFPSAFFSSSDYFSLFPWFFLFLAGFFVHQLWKVKTAGRDLPQKYFTFPAFFGKNAFVIYLLHQPVLLLSFFLFS